MIWCRRRGLPGDGSPPLGAYTTWIWDPRSPNAVQEVPVSTAIDGSEDLFCGAGTFMGDGRLIHVGGTDMTQYTPVDGIIVGTDLAWIFDNAQGPGWAWHRVTGAMNRPRWYPSCFQLSDGRIFVPGNHDELNPQPDPATRYTRDVGTVVGLSATWEFGVNHQDDGTCPTTQYGLDNYPRMHLLQDGNLFRTHDPLSYFVFDQCTATAEPDRVVGDLSPALPKEVEPVHASVHYVYPGATPGSWEEVIYAVGGGSDIGCMGTTFITDAVVKIQPQTGSTATWQSVPSLNYARVNANAIIMLDGSILAVGGHRKEGAQCPTVLNAERYRPPEIFGAGAGGQWQVKAAHLDDRTYHGVAGMFPDGSILVGGSVGTDESFEMPQPCWHSLEVYYPHYFYLRDARPVITLVNGSTDQSQALDYGQQVSITTDLFTDGSGQFRVALVAPCTGTHGADFNQRYIVLNVAGFSLAGDEATFDATMPPTTSIAPRGWYMLTVVNANGLPSAAWWVQLQ